MRDDALVTGRQCFMIVTDTVADRFSQRSLIDPVNERLQIRNVSIQKSFVVIINNACSEQISSGTPNLLSTWDEHQSWFVWR